MRAALHLLLQRDSAGAGGAEQDTFRLDRGRLGRQHMVMLGAQRGDQLAQADWAEGESCLPVSRTR